MLTCEGHSKFSLVFMAISSSVATNLFILLLKVVFCAGNRVRETDALEMFLHPLECATAGRAGPHR